MWVFIIIERQSTAGYAPSDDRQLCGWGGGGGATATK